MTPASVALPVETALVVGTGLIGTSVAMALGEKGVRVFLDDARPDRVAVAVELGAGARFAGDSVDVAVLAVPPLAVGQALRALQSRNVASTYMDVASVKAKPQADAEALGCDMTRYVGGHPVAGRERSGPAAARADLFVGRPWVLTPTARTSSDVLARARWVVQACGAEPAEMSAEDHDLALAVLSHLPQLAASALAAMLLGVAEPSVRLAGQGLRDMTRLAGSDAQLWAGIAVANAGAVADAVREFGQRLDRVAAALRAYAHGAAGAAEAAAAVDALVRDGNAGRLRVPGKHGGRPTRFAAVPVLVPDEPGQLAKLLQDAGGAGINVEDITVEHSPGRPMGVVELHVRSEAAEPLRAVLEDVGWRTYADTSTDQ